MPRPSAKAHALQPLAAVLPHALQRLGLGQLAWLGTVVQHWRDIVGEQLAAVTSPVNLRRQVLFVAVKDPLWLQELAFYQARVLDNLRRRLGEVPIRKVHFILATSAPTPPAPAPPAVAAVSLSAAEAQELQETTAAIRDPEVREAVRRAWRKGWQTRREQG
ncbi:MAG: hypothetical protein KatS3mg131_0867 [Candidatus Tectimicrobiota bacterium]|nr:MAG: hypothetical protein KatS3mg131_0867 [Candidatus Tectomicrobia bacterium]